MNYLKLMPSQVSMINPHNPMSGQICPRPHRHEDLASSFSPTGLVLMDNQYFRDLHVITIHSELLRTFQPSPLNVFQ